jgi:signal peptidase I
MKNKLLIILLVLILVLILVYITINFYFMSNNLSLGMVGCSSKSMYPNLNCSCILLEQTINYPGQVHIGDVIVFRGNYDGEMLNIVHRVVEKYRNYVVTKGDNNNFTEDYVYYEQMLTKVKGFWCP